MLRFFNPDMIRKFKNYINLYIQYNNLSDQTIIVKYNYLNI